VVAADRGQQPQVVRVGVLIRGPGLERVEQAADLRVGEAAVADHLERRGVVRAGGGPGRRHHRVLVPEQQGVDAAEVGQLGHALSQRLQLAWGRRHEPASA
jgi:hypothetical protein